jgi:hypothetical protein
MIRLPGNGVRSNMTGSNAPGFTMGDEHPKAITQKQMKTERADDRLK